MDGLRVPPSREIVEVSRDFFSRAKHGILQRIFSAILGDFSSFESTTDVATYHCIKTTC